MKMQILSNRIDEALDSVPVVNGGTGARTKETACENLSLVSQDQIRQTDGIIVLGENSLINRNDISPDIINGDIPSLSGPIQVDIGKTVFIYITNYSSDVDYVVTVSGGTFVRELDKITFTAGMQVANGKVIVNDRVFDILVSQPVPLRPAIVSPTGLDLLDLTQTVTFTSSAFIAGSPGDTHGETEWELSTDLNFTTIVASLVAYSDLLHWTASGLQKNKTYYARMRHYANNGGRSAWSPVVLLKTRFAFVPSQHLANIYPNDVETEDAFGYVVSANRDASLIAASSKTADVNGLYNQGAVYLFGRQGQQVSQIAKIVSGLFGAGGVNVEMTIPATGSITIESDAPGWVTQTFTSSQNISLAVGSTTVTITGKGQDGATVLSGGQGSSLYPDGLPVYNPGQAASGPSGNPAYPSGLPAYNAGQAYIAPTTYFYWVRDTGDLSPYHTIEPVYQTNGVSQPSYAPTYANQVVNVGGYSSYNGSGYDNWDTNYYKAHTGTTGGQAYIAPTGDPAYPSGLPPYSTGQSYIPPTGNPSYPNGLPPYVAHSTLISIGDRTEIRINNQRYIFLGGVGVPAVESTYGIQSLLGENFGYSLSISDDGRYVAAATDTIIPKKRNVVIDVSTSGSVQFQTDSPDLNLVTYTTDTAFNIPPDAQTLTMTGQGNPGLHEAASAAFNQALIGTGTKAIPRRITSLSVRGKGEDGYVIPQDWKFFAADRAFRGNGESAIYGTVDGYPHWTDSTNYGGPIVYATARKNVIQTPPDVYSHSFFYLKADGSTYFGGDDGGAQHELNNISGNIGVQNIINACSADNDTAYRIFPLYLLGQGGAIWYCTGVNSATLIATCPIQADWVDLQVLGFTQGNAYDKIALLASDGKVTFFTGNLATPWRAWSHPTMSLPADKVWSKLTFRIGSEFYAIAKTGEFYCVWDTGNNSVSPAAKFPYGEPVFLTNHTPGSPTGITTITAMNDDGQIGFYNPDSNNWSNYISLPQRPNSVITGDTATVTLNGQTYTFLGGVGIPAVERTEVIQLPGTFSANCDYNSPTGTLINLEYQALPEGNSTGDSTFVTLGVQQYEFPGGTGGPASATTRVIDLTSEPGSGAVIIAQITDGVQTGQKTLLPDTATANLLFGYALDFDKTGNRMAVASPGYNNNQGKVTLYTRNNGNWIEEETIIANDFAMGDKFGSSLSLSENGDVLIIGSPEKNNGKGAVYVFKRTGVTWLQKAKVASLNTPQAGVLGQEGFGHSVDVSNDNSGLFSFIVGAPLTSVNGFSECGIAYTFTYSALSDVCLHDETFAQPTDSTLTYAMFGVSVSIDGNQTVVAIGVSHANYNSTKSGVVYTYAKSNTGDWLRDEKLIFPNINTYDYQGSSVALSLDAMYLITSSPYHDTSRPNTGSNTGLVSIYKQP